VVVKKECIYLWNLPKEEVKKELSQVDENQSFANKFFTLQMRCCFGYVLCGIPEYYAVVKIQLFLSERKKEGFLYISCLLKFLNRIAVP